jgi:hypothetical protein
MCGFYFITIFYMAFGERSPYDRELDRQIGFALDPKNYRDRVPFRDPEAEGVPAAVTATETAAIRDALAKALPVDAGLADLAQNGEVFPRK